MESFEKLDHTPGTKAGYSTLKILLFLSASAFYSCDQIKKEAEEASLPSSTGEFAEMIVLTDRASTEQLKGSIESHFAYDAPALPPPAESVRKLRFTDQDFFKGFFRKHYQVLVLVHRNNWATLAEYFPEQFRSQISTHVQGKKAGMITLRDVWAKPQTVHVLVAANVDDLNQLMANSSESLDRQLAGFSRESHLTSIYGKGLYTDSHFVNMISMRNFGISIPPSFRISADRNDFLWFRKNGPKYDLGIFVYDEPYQNIQQFSPEYIASRRNQMTQKYIKGQLDSTWMSIEPIIPMKFDTTEFKGNYTIETRGWWKLQNDFMGGPFLSYTVLSPDKKRVITIEGNVYAPNEPKFKRLRELEIIMGTLKWK